MSEKTPPLEETFAAIAHQWRQPLNEINALVSSIDNRLYEKNIIDSQIEKQLAEIEKITRSMSQSIDDFRGYFSKKLQKQSIDVSLLLQKILQEYQNILEKYTITLHCNVEKNLYIEGDENILKQIIVTIFNNAKDAFLARNVYRGIIDVTVKEKDDRVVFIVADNAGGIPKSTKEKLFEADFTSKHSSEGTGLGLYMVKKLLSEHFLGEIFAKNSEKGVAFHMVIPRKREES
jgi:signal transduction histidine kinase